MLLEHFLFLRMGLPHLTSAFMKVAPKNTVVPLLLGSVRTVRDCCQLQEMEMCRKLVSTPSQLACLLAVPVQADEFNVDQVAKVMGLSPSRASRVVDSLVCSGLLYRRTADSDRRIHLLALTPAGGEKCHEVDILLVECEKNLLSKLPHQRSRVLEEVLKTLVNAW